MQQLENALSTSDPKYSQMRDIYAFMTMVVTLHEFVHEASRRTRYKLWQGWDSVHDEGSKWEYDMFGRYIEFTTQKMALQYAKDPKNGVHNSVQTFMGEDPSMGIFGVIYVPAAGGNTETTQKKKPDADREAAKRSGGAH